MRPLEDTTIKPRDLDALARDLLSRGTDESVAERLRTLARPPQFGVRHFDGLRQAALHEFRRDHPEALNLLLVAASLAPVGLPYEMFVDQWDSVAERAPNALPADPEAAFRTALDRVAERFDVDRDDRQELFALRETLVDDVREFLRDDETRFWRSKAATLVQNALPFPGPGSDGPFERLLPHATFVVEQLRLNAVGHGDGIAEETVRYNLGVHYRERGRYEDADRELAQVVGARERLADVNDDASMRELARVHHALGDLRRQQDRVEESAAHYRSASDLWERYAPDHPHRAWTLNNFGLLLSQVGQRGTALRLLKRARRLRAREVRRLGSEGEARPAQDLLEAQFWLVDSMANYATAWEDDARAQKLLVLTIGDTELLLDQIEQEFDRLYERKEWSRESRTTLRALDSLEFRGEALLASCQHELGAWHVDAARRSDGSTERREHLEEADGLFELSMETRARLFGADHPQFAGSLYGRAKLATEEGRPAQAEDLLDRARRIWAAFHANPAHHDVAFADFGLAQMHDSLNHPALALRHYQFAFDVWSRDAPNHKRTQRCLEAILRLEAQLTPSFAEGVEAERSRQELREAQSRLLQALSMVESQS